ncbi:MAG: hypothetical protein CMK09_01605 [Ponticaulis sp.]|nr:hypothetical protein [Ponticaulis sp.]
MRKLFAALCLAGSAGLAACTTSTGYGPAAPGYDYGFAETRIEQNRWQVTFSGNSLTDLQTVETYLLYRAAELTNQQGFDHFIMVDRKLDEDTRFQSTGFGRSPFAVQYFHPRWGWRYYHDPFYDPFYNDRDLREVTRYRAIAEIVMGRGPKPRDPKAYNAEDVLMNLGPAIRRPANY